jgi:hypothetical protein
MNGPTNDPMNHPELTSTLNKRADDFARLGGHDLDLAQVVSRAGEIRRGRRMRASMAMAAVAIAVAVPVGVTVLGNDPTRVDPTPAPTSTPTAVQTNHDPISLDGLTQGDMSLLGVESHAAISYRTDRLPLGPGGEVRDIAQVQGGFLVVRSDDQGTRTVSFLGDDGTSPDLTWPIGDGGIAVSPEGNVGAFVEPDGTVRVVQDAGSRNFAITQIKSAGALEAGAVLGENCSGRSESAQCVVFVNDLGENQQVLAVSYGEGAARASTKLQRVTDAHGTELIGIKSVSDGGSCSALESLDGGAELWSTCEFQLQKFSPDGTHVLGVQAYGDGLGDTRLAVLDASDGQAVLDLAVADGVTLYALAWEDDAHVLAVAGKGSTYELIRFSLDGNRQLVVGPENGADDVTPPLRIPVG